jgi:DNA (cytosine-5)-methyltransferase 1
MSTAIAKARRGTKRRRKTAEWKARHTLLVADLFCGAGGSSTGCRRALKRRGLPMQLVAVNHWPIAVETHKRNHPDARHYCVNLDAADPLTIVPEGRLDLLMASPECRFFSSARGGKAIDDQNRMSAWHVVRWCTELRVRVVLVENVPEFQRWGPLNEHDRPIKEREGEYFNALVCALERIGFKVEWRVLNAADYGEATTRRRLFLIARSDGRPIRWPRKTHSKDGKGGHRWRAAAEVIDWDLEGASIFSREKPLSPKTIQRIWVGALKYGWDEPWLVLLRNHADARGIELPLPTICAGGNHIGVAVKRRRGPKAFILPQRSGDLSVRGADVPLPGITTVARPALVEGRRAVIRGRRSNDASKDPAVDPVPAITTSSGGGIMVFEATKRGPEPLHMRSDCQGGNGLNVRDNSEPLYTPTGAAGGGLAVVVPQGGGGRAREVGKPLPTVHGDGAIALVSTYNRTGKARPVTEPLPTQTTKDRHGLVMPVTHSDQSCRARSTADPLSTITGANRGELAFLTPGFGERKTQTPRTHSVEEPLPTIPARGHTHLAEPSGPEPEYDIKFRMLQPHELAMGMGFSSRESKYEFVGNKTERTKQIGNAVSVRQAAALVGAIFADEALRKRRRSA